MPKFRTPKKDCTTYIYKDAYERKAAEAWIADTHAFDDEVHNVAKRDSYPSVSYYENQGSEGDSLPSDRQTDLADHDANPETILI